MPRLVLLRHAFTSTEGSSRRAAGSATNLLDFLIVAELCYFRTHCGRQSVFAFQSICGSVGLQEAGVSSDITLQRAETVRPLHPLRTFLRQLFDVTCAAIVQDADCCHACQQQNRHQMPAEHCASVTTLDTTISDLEQKRLRFSDCHASEFVQ